MKSIASAPGKIILFGEHFVVYGVKAILCAIDKRITVHAEKIPEKKILIKSDLGEFEAPPGKVISDIDGNFRPFYFLAIKMLENHQENTGIKIKIDSQIPPGVGLGSSSACCVAAAAAISGVYSKLGREEILQLAIEAEKTIFPNTSGADCTVCTYGGIIQYDKQKGHFKIESQPNFRLVIANSKMEHSTKEVVFRVKTFKENNEEKFSNLCSEEEKIIDGVLIDIKNNNLRKIGENIRKNQIFLEEIGVSNEQLKNMIKVANQTSYGAKITGAGGGGCILALTDKTNLKETIKNLENFECFSTKIDFKGLDTF